MTLLELAEAHVPLRRVGKEWHGPCPACGPGKSGPEKTDRFSVKADGRFFCRTCTEKGGDIVTFLRKFEGKTCPEAHALAGKECRSTTCAMLEKCSKGKKGTTFAPRPLRTPQEGPAPQFTPAEATPPAERWLRSAEKLIERANKALLDCPEQLAYLARRGLPREAVEKFRLGWLSEDFYRPRSAWGLPEVISERTKKPKRLWLPSGIVIPFFGDDGRPFRIRIRRPKVKEGQPRYYWVPGSGDDVPVIGSAARAFIVVESDLDGYLVAWHAGDLVGALPLGTCSAKPKETAAAALGKALAILVSLDFEPRENERTGKHENPGGKASNWWLEHFPRAKRWPVPAGKDPGEFFQDHGGDIRAWVLAGLPPVFHLQTAAPSPAAEKKTEVPKEIPADTCEKETPADSAPPPEEAPKLLRAVSKKGVPFFVAPRPSDLPRLVEAYPDHVPFLEEEIKIIQGWPREHGDILLRMKQVFPDSRIVSMRPVVGDGSNAKLLKFDPSRQRRARRGLS